jgi:flagellar FliL protein
MPLDVTRRRFLRLLGLGAAGTVLPACGGAATPTVEAPAKGKVDEHGAPVKGGAADGHGAEGDHGGGQAKELWLKSGGDDLLKGKTFQTLFNGLPNRMKALELKDTNLRCIDEGCPGGIHMAGSGVLYEGTANDLKGKIGGIYTHDGCGAAKLYCEQQKIKTDDPDAVADDRAKKLAEKLGVPFLGRIKAAQMSRPADMHDARALYYDGTGNLDPAQVPGMPKGFMVTRRYISDVNYAKAEVDVAIGIAMGDHGFGKLFTNQSPFYLVGVTGLDKDSIPAQALANELKAVAEPFPNVAVHVLDVGPNGASAEPAKTVIKGPPPAAAPAAAKAGQAPKTGAAPKPGAPPAPAKARPSLPEQQPSFGPTYVMRDRIVNLADPGGRRYLRYSAGIEFAPPEDPNATPAPAKKKAATGYQTITYVPDEDAATYQEMTGGGAKDTEKEFQTRIKKYIPAIEDSVVMVLSSKTFDDIRTVDGKEQARREVRGAVQEALGKAETITAVYFTEFVVQ